ncbi:MAG: response regulator [Cytophaga sp.]|nr:response regulator [Undibacterium sp.]
MTARFTLGFMRLFNRLLPSSLTNRVFALYSITLLIFVGGGLALFLKFNFQRQIEQTELASFMLVEVVAQAVQDSVVIGDYDTVKKILDKGVQGSVFESSAFIDLSGGVIDVKRRSAANFDTPTWIVRWVDAQLDDINRTISVGGKDYGVLRLRFDIATVAHDIWSLSLFALSLGVVSLLGGLLLIRFPLARWLGSLDRLRDMVEALGTGQLDAEKLDASDEPTEIKKVVDIFNKTAMLVRERETSRRALNDQKFALDQHAIVSITDVNGNITYANDRFCEISEYRQDELLGENHRKIKSDVHTPEFFTDLWKTIGSGIVWHGEICDRKRSGALYWVRATIVPLLDETGRPHQYIAISTDITAGKEAEALILHAKEAAEDASRVKSDFLANMSHEIRTPMNGILGMTELALDTQLTSEQREYMTIVKISADSLLQIVNDILDFSKIEAGRMDIEHIEFSLEQMLNNTMKALAVRAHQRNLELVLQVNPDVPDRLLGDPGRLRQIIFNLVGNAIKFTEAGEVHVLVSCVEPEIGARMNVCFEVRDTGIGIPKEKFDVIFKSFSQADTSTTRQYGGTGLGLTISAQLIALMGGHLGVESEVGKGSRFFFTLGMHAVLKQALVQYQHAARIADLPVLIADDNATNRNLLAQILRSWKMKPTAVASGREAIAELERASVDGTPYALALLDLQMPEMDGFELAEKILQHPEYVNATVMMLTSEGQPGHAARCRELGIASYLLKPVSQAELLNAIMTALGESIEQQATLITRHSLRENRKKLHLLLAEDNLVNQTLAVRLLEKLGHTVSVAHNGVEAVQQWQAGVFDAILMDVDMPVMNGYEATQKIREHERLSNQHISIIAMTAHAMQGVREICIQNGMDAYLSKPIDTEALWQQLDMLGSKEHDSYTKIAAVAPTNMIADLAQTREMIGNELAVFDTLVGLFSKDIEKHTLAIRQGLAEGDRAAVKHSAHSIKGMGGIFFAESTMQLAGELEKYAGQENAHELFLQLELAIVELRTVIADYQW